MFASIAVGMGLCAWAALCLVLVRSAELRAFGQAPPVSLIALALGVAIAALAVARGPSPLASCSAGVACISLLAAAFADARTGLIFDAVTLPAAVIVAALSVFSGTTSEAARGVLVLVGCFGAVVVYSRGRWMGLGDVKAMYVLGAAFGPAESLLAIFVASLGGTAAVMLRGARTREHELRFGPHLAAGAAFTLVAGGPIVHRGLGL